MAEEAAGGSWGEYLHFHSPLSEGASSSKASNMGISTNDILTAADWSSESVFEKFYYKSTQDPSFGRAVLGSHKRKKLSSQRQS